MPYPFFTAFAHQRHGGALVIAGVIFALGIAFGAMVRPSSLPQSAPHLTPRAQQWPQ